MNIVQQIHNDFEKRQKYFFHNYDNIFEFRLDVNDIYNEKIIYRLHNRENFHSNFSKIHIGQICTHLEELSDLNKFDNINVIFKLEISFNTDGIDTEKFEPSLYFNERSLERVIEKFKCVDNLDIELYLIFYENFNEVKFIEEVENCFDNLFSFSSRYTKNTDFTRNSFCEEHINSYIKRIKNEGSKLLELDVNEEYDNKLLELDANEECNNVIISLTIYTSYILEDISELLKYFHNFNKIDSFNSYKRFILNVTLNILNFEEKIKPLEFNLERIIREIFNLGYIDNLLVNVILNHDNNFTEIFLNNLETNKNEFGIYDKDSNIRFNLTS